MRYTVYRMLLDKGEYIGITADLEARIKNHKSRMKAQYDAEILDVVVVSDGLTKGDAVKLEKELISKQGLDNLLNNANTSFTDFMEIEYIPTVKDGIVEVPNMREAIIYLLTSDTSRTKYAIAKALNLSTSAHVNNYLGGKTKKARVEVMRILYDKFNVLVESYKNSIEYKAMLREKAEPAIKEIKV